MGIMGKCGHYEPAINSATDDRIPKRSIQFSLYAAVPTSFSRAKE